MRKIILLFFLSICFLYGDEYDDDLDALLSQYTNQELDDLVRDAIIQPVARNFSTIDGSTNFIKQFSLSKSEQDIIGNWQSSEATRLYDYDGEGAGSSISFLPNRYFTIYKTSSDDIGAIRYTVGCWKIEDNLLMVRFVCRLSTIKPYVYNIERMDNNTYYPIFNVPKYKKYFINMKPFDWSTIPKKLRDFYEINIEDSPRSCLLFDTLGSNVPGDLRQTSTLGKLLLNPKDTDEYILKLVNVW